MKSFTLIGALALTALSSPAFAYHCTAISNPFPAFTLRCDPWMSDVYAWPQNQSTWLPDEHDLQIGLSNVACDRQGDLTKMKLGYGIIYSTINILPEGIFEEKLSAFAPEAPPYGDQTVRTLTSLSYSETQDSGVLNIAAGERFDHSEQSSYNVQISFDKTKLLPATQYSQATNIHPATVVITRTAPDGKSSTFVSKKLFCSLNNAGVKSVSFSPATGYITVYGN